AVSFLIFNFNIEGKIKHHKKNEILKMTMLVFNFLYLLSIDLNGLKFSPM
ncbi:MAG: hypothetical protein ACI9LI_000673, partial [Saprospiraceae bacterium]